MCVYVCECVLCGMLCVYVCVSVYCVVCYVRICVSVYCLVCYVCTLRLLLLAGTNFSVLVVCCIWQAGFHTEGGGGETGISPPRSSFPPPKNLRIIIEKSAQ